MNHKTVKSFLDNAISSTAQNISEYVYHPGRDFIRSRKLPSDKLMLFLISQGASSTGNELLDFYSLAPDAPSNSAFNQQRAKLKPEALQCVFNCFQTSTDSLYPSSGFRFLAADGSDFTFYSRPEFTSDEYFVSEGHSMNGFYTLHLNAMFDLDRHTYTDAFLQPTHEKDEYFAFCRMVDRYRCPSEIQTVFIGDRGYCSYNNMAHVIQGGHCFVFRAKDILSKGILGNFDFPDSNSFDVSVTVTLVRSKSKKIGPVKGYKRFVDANTAFDFIPYKSLETYEMSFRVVRFPISENGDECILTNLPEQEFPMERIKEIYGKRWGIESSFRKLKYTIGLSNFHSYHAQYIQQEIWAKLIAYNAAETIINMTVIEKKDTKHMYKVNFSRAAHICRIFLRLTTEKDSIQVMELLEKELIPIRNDRQYPRLKTAHFRRPRYYIYRSA